MPSPRLRAKSVRGGFSLTVNEEVRLGIRHAEYVWKLSRFLLPQPGVRVEASLARQMIETAREHEAAMWRKYPNGPEATR